MRWTPAKCAVDVVPMAGVEVETVVEDTDKDDEDDN
jgi:hypothetical protein